MLIEKTTQLKKKKLQFKLEWEGGVSNRGHNLWVCNFDFIFIIDINKKINLLIKKC